jgi:opacity protein-like surface antigen
MKRGLALAVLILTIPSAAFATTGVKPVTLGGNFTMGFPVDEFKDNVDEIGIGGMGYATFTLPGSPLQLGGSLGYMSQGSATVRSDVLVPGGVILPVDVVTRNNVFMGHLLLRLQYMDSPFRPYADGLFGFGRYWTTTEVTVFEETEVQNNRDLDSWTANYGLGGGFMVEVYRDLSAGEEAGTGHDMSVCVDLGVRYLIGGKADYAKIDTVDENGYFDTTSSRTDQVTVHIGVALQFF